MTLWKSVEKKPISRQLKWYHKNKEKAALYSREYRKRPDVQVRRKEYSKVASKERSAKERERVFSHYGKICLCCGDKHYEFLSIDHINGGGRKHIREVGNLYRWLIKNDFPNGFQTLCHNCNRAKHIYGICPHQKEKQNGR